MALALHWDLTDPSNYALVGPEVSCVRASVKLVLANDDYYHEISANVLPFKGATWSGDTPSGTADGLHLESERTNLLPDSIPGTGSWTDGAAAVTTENTGEVTAFDGSSQATLLVDDNAGGTSSIFCQIALTGMALSTEHCLWGIFEKKDADFVQIRVGAMGATVPYQVFNLNTGALGATAANVNDAGIEQIGSSNRYLCWMTFTSDASDANWNPQIRAQDSDSTGGVEDRDGTTSIYLHHAQLEVGAFPTSPIVTSGGTATRNADEVSTTDVVWLNYDAGTYYAHGQKDYAEAGKILVNASSSLNNYHSIGTNWNGSSFDFRAFTTDGNDGQIQGHSFTEGEVVRAVLGYAANDMAAYVNGSSAGTEETVDLPAGPFNRIDIGNDRNGGAEYNGVISEIRYYDTRLTNAELEDMSNGTFPVLDAGLGFNDYFRDFKVR